MRRASILAALIAGALPSGGAAADDNSSRWIRVQQLSTGGGMVQAGTEKWIEIQGWDWEIEAKDNLYSFKVGGGSAPSQDGPALRPSVGRVLSTDGSAAPAARRPSDLTMKRGTSPAPTARPLRPIDTPMDYHTDDTGTHEAPGRGGSETITIGGARTESPPEKEPLTGYLWGFKVGAPTGSPTPPDKFGRVRVKFAWDRCAVGSRLPLVELRDSRTLYRLEDVTVASCAADGASLRYARLRRSAAR